MFAVLYTGKSDSIFKKLKIHSQRIPLPEGDAFFLVRAKNLRSKASFKKLENCLGILKKDTILGNDITLPEDCGISVFTPDILPRLSLINSAASKLKACHYESLIIYDEKGIYPDYTRQFLGSFDRIRIVTPFPRKYDTLAESLMENYGFSLEVSTESTFAGDVIISHICHMPLYYSGTVFSNQKKYLMNAEVFTGKKISLPPIYENLRPKDISPLLFASALYEKCNVKSLGNLKYKDFDC